MRVLVTGGAGQLVRVIRQTWTEHDLILPDEADLDLSRRDSIHQVVAQVRPDVVINCGAFTQVDRCESEAETALLINGTAVGVLFGGGEHCKDRALHQHAVADLAAAGPAGWACTRPRCSQGSFSAGRSSCGNPLPGRR
ncbi:MAG: sugar nucleotide-binding protein [Holophaga sp.]|nr:sugar nucleotide-binding protein [Holophaga sp.]